MITPQTQKKREPKLSLSYLSYFHLCPWIILVHQDSATIVRSEYFVVIIREETCLDHHVIDSLKMIREVTQPFGRHIE
jgi:hypothetical protein